ncbi:MAG: sulfatase-like hydrolase/transferase [Cyclobacteriaceae bacterium]
MKAILINFIPVIFISVGWAQSMDESPNIVIILADDFGYGSVNSYGASKELIRTPNIDKIADEGMRFTDTSTPSSVCSPTRYSLLTGEYPWRSSLKYGVVGMTSPLLPDPNRTSLSSWLETRGYNSAAIGKWHLGYTNDTPDYTKKLTPGPVQLGFDYHFDVPQNHGDVTGVYVENEYVYGLRSDKVQPYSRSYYGRQYFGVDAPQRVNANVMGTLTDKAVEWLKRQNKDEPFFLYFTPVAVHHPITPSDGMRGLSDAGPYGDFIQDLDLSVGRILATLDYMGLTDNTLVIFTSDNGGQIPNEVDTGPVEDYKKTPEIQAVNAGLKINGSFRGDKHTIWEGGTRVPFIVKWPGVVEEGSVSDEMINIVDIFATVAEITDGEAPSPVEAAPDSYSFLPVLTQSGDSERKTMVTANANGIQAIRKGKWKYVDYTPPSTLPVSRLGQFGDLKEPQLYNLAEDPDESVNLFNDSPDIVDELLRELEKIRKQPEFKSN